MPARMARRAAKLWPLTAYFGRWEGNGQAPRISIRFNRTIRQRQHGFPLTKNLNASFAENIVQRFATGQKPSRAQQPSAPREIPPRHPSSPMARR
jgi:hypothetical protein